MFKTRFLLDLLCVVFPKSFKFWKNNLKRTALATWINISIWATAHLPLPQPNINLNLLSIDCCWVGGGVRWTIFQILILIRQRYKTIGFYVSHAFMGKFVEHKRIVRVARGLVESKSSFLSDTCWNMNPPVKFKMLQIEAKLSIGFALEKNKWHV